MPVGPARPIDVVVHFPHSFLSLPPLRSPFLLRFIKCPLNGPIVRPINPFLSTDRPKERTSFARSVGQTSSVHPTTVLAHAIGDDDASLLSHTEEVEDTARVAVNGFLPLNALLRLRRLLVTSFAPYVWPSTTWCLCEVPPCSIKRGTSAAPASKK